MENLDFEIEIDLASGRDYPVTVVHSPAGEGRGTLHFPYDELALDNHLTKLQLALLNSGRGQRRVVPAEERTVREFGTALFDALFAGEVRTLLDVSRHEARSKGTGLRVKLRCRAPELAALPWEFLFDTEVDEYLCLSRQTPLVRYLEVSTPCEPLKVALPLRILGVVASPKDLDALDVDREKQRVEQAVAHLVESGKVELEWLAKPTWRELQSELSRRKWHVVHFVGHGGFDQRRDEGVLAFEDDDGNAHLLGAGDVGLLLGDHDDLRLAVLNACEGARSSARDVFSSTAAVLVRKGTPGVVAMQYEITDLAAIELARSFYDCIAAGQPVDTAMSEARKAVRLSLPGTLEWGTPVLFMRAPDGVLFDLDGEAPSVPSRRAAPPTPPRRPRERRDFRVPGGRPVQIAAAGVAVAVVAAVVAVLATTSGSAVSKALLKPQGLAFAGGRVYVGDAGHHRIISMTPDGTKVRLVAGSGSGAIRDDKAAKAGVGWTKALAVGPDGVVYLADSTQETGGNAVIRRLVGGRLETFLPPSGITLYANGLAASRTGRLYVLSFDTVYAYDGGNAFKAVTAPGTVQNPLGGAVGPDGSLYFCDSDNWVVKRLAPDGTLSVIAGTGPKQGFNGRDGDLAVKVGLGYPADDAFDSHGNLYVLSQDGSIREIANGAITTVLEAHGDGNVDGPVAVAQVGEIDDIAVTPAGDVFFLDLKFNHVRRIHNGVVSTVA
ncbi:MAG TPA: CHAT domain-containing protein [Acidimicrobiales bacterium]|nr:CHAT domain-containing protein [Acidimicrobiales bacterium]